MDNEYGITAEHIGTEATDADVSTLVAFLEAEGISLEMYNGIDHVVWVSLLNRAFGV